MPTTDFLLHTKFRFPPARSKIIARPHLVALLNEGLGRPLTLVSAPAGFGKTTLLGEWRQSESGRARSAAWLSLDNDDNELTYFLTYLLAAIGTIAPGLGEPALTLLQSPQPPSVSGILTALINDLSMLPQPAALILDDYHVISAEAVQQAVTFLLDHLPEQMHLVILTRSDPPLPLARLRARDQLVEIRADELRFATEEATAFLEQVMNLVISPSDIATLETRTEGWIAGLQMAALSMQGRSDLPQFIREFSGSHRYILDYLVEEVLANQPPQIQRFLLYTSILERLTSPLCDAVLAGDGEVARIGGDWPTGSESSFAGQSASILEYLERANLFLVPLDEARTWYRYHRLFADLLRTQSQKSLGAQGVAQLHVRASEWHAQHGSILDAIHHASMASDDERVERFIEQNYVELVKRGEQAGLRFWIGGLSQEQVYRRPRLCIYEAYSHSWFGRLDEADRLLDEAENRIRSDILAPDAKSMLGLLTYVRSRVTAMRGDIDRAIELCLAVRDYVPADNLPLQLDSHITLGYEYFLKGDYDNASLVLNETIRSGIAAGAVINTVAASCVLARLYATEGLLRESYNTYQTALRSVPEASEQHLGARALVEMGIADVLYEWNDLDAALVHIKQGLAPIRFD